MEKEIPILSLVYVERLIINSGFYVTPVNWRKIAFGSLMVASKVKHFLSSFNLLRFGMMNHLKMIVSIKLFVYILLQK